MMPAEMLCVAAGGALGALCRHGVSLWCVDRFGKAFPCGTLLVNVSGSLLMGLLAGCWQRWGTSSVFALFAGAGFLGALTTFSFANDVAKYFAIIPAMFAGLFVADGMASGPLSALNIMGLNSPQSAILSTMIFNALVIVALIPLALKGVSYRPAGAASLLKRNILIYGVGGLIAPFMGIKLIDMVINAWRLV